MCNFVNSTCLFGNNATAFGGIYQNQNARKCPSLGMRCASGLPVRKGYGVEYLIAVVFDATPDITIGHLLIGDRAKTPGT